MHHSQQISPDCRALFFFTTRHDTTTHMLQATATTMAPPAATTTISRSCILPINGLDAVGAEGEEEGEGEREGEEDGYEEVGTGQSLRSKTELKQFSSDGCGTSSAETSSREEMSGYSGEERRGRENKRGERERRRW